MLDFRWLFFSILWALATLFHYQAFHKWDEGIFVWVGALLVLIYPSKSYSLLILALLQVCEVVINMPIKNNHWLLMFFANMTILIAYCSECFCNKGFRINQKALFDAFAPYLRYQLMILYFFAVLHKLNFDFFDLDLSCGAQFYRGMAERFFFIPHSRLMEMMTIHATLVIEIALPILLAWRKTRFVGVIAGICFHGIIGFNPLSEFWNFSAAVYPFLFLFAPNDFFTWFKESWFKLKLKNLKYLLLALTFGIVVLYIKNENKHVEIIGGLAIWTVYFLFALLITIQYFLSKKTLPFRFKRYSLLVIVPILMFINGMSPYLGFKTESSFSMFSNLRTENGMSNHFFIPISWQCFDFQKDIVEIIDSNDIYLKELSKQNQLLPYYSFSEYVRTKKDLSVTFLRKGVIQTINNVSESAETIKNSSPFCHAFLVFKPIYKSVRPGGR